MDVPIIDSHVHLWSAETANPVDHAWITPGHVLQKPQLLSDYRDGLQQSDAGVTSRMKGAIYVETDLFYELPGNDLLHDVATWAKRPLDEIRFLRTTLAESTSIPLLAVIPWAPLPQHPDIFKSYLALAQAAAAEAWPKVRGFRYLVQCITNREVFKRTVTNNKNFFSNLQELGRQRLSFEVAVDQNGSKGTWQMEEIARLMEQAHQGVALQKRVTFIINHLCKPDFSSGYQSAEFEEWQSAIERLGKIDGACMKLSGAFSELPSHSLRETNPEEIPRKVADLILPWFKTVISAFSPSRVMFGSDWPVCTVAFPGSHRDMAWSAWQSVVQMLVNDCSLNEDEAAMLWGGTAQRAYQLGLAQP